MSNGPFFLKKISWFRILVEWGMAISNLKIIKRDEQVIGEAGNLTFNGSKE